MALNVGNKGGASSSSSCRALLVTHVGCCKVHGKYLGFFPLNSSIKKPERLKRRRIEAENDPSIYNR